MEQTKINYYYLIDNGDGENYGTLMTTISKENIIKSVEFVKQVKEGEYTVDDLIEILKAVDPFAKIIIGEKILF